MIFGYDFVNVFGHIVTQASVNLPATDHTKVISHVFLSTISEQWHNTHWTRLEVLRGLGAVSLRLRSVVTCESVHVITCCMLPYIHYCVFTVIEITVIY